MRLTSAGTGLFPHLTAGVAELRALQAAEHALVARTTGLPMYTPEVVPAWPEPPDPPAPPAPPSPPAPPPAPPAAPRAVAPLARPAAFSRSRLRFRQAVRVPGRLTWRLRAGGHEVARGARTLRRGATVTVRLRATRTGRARLRRTRRLVLETRLVRGPTRHVRRDRVAG